MPGPLDHTFGEGHSGPLSGEGERPGALFTYALPDGNEMVVYPLLFGKARLVLGEAGRPWWDRGYDYESAEEAIDAALGWIDTNERPPGNIIRQREG